MRIITKQCITTVRYVVSGSPASSITIGEWILERHIEAWRFGPGGSVEHRRFGFSYAAMSEADQWIIAASLPWVPLNIRALEGIL